MPIHNTGVMYAKDDKHESQNIHKSIELKCPLHISNRLKEKITMAVDSSMLCHTLCIKIYVLH